MENKTAKDFLAGMGYLDPTMYGEPYNQIKVSELMESYASSYKEELASLKEVVKELIPILDEYTRIRSIKQKYSPEHHEEHARIKSIIERAKRLSDNK